MSDHFSLIVWLLPIVFMLHELEEIVFVRLWFEKNGSYLQRRFPAVARRIGDISTAGFSVAVAEEFILLGAITVTAVLTGWHLLWLAAFGGFGLHLVVHIGQWIMLRRYIPGIWTTLGALGYCAWGVRVMLTENVFTSPQIALWAAIGLAIVAVNLLFAHWLARKFDAKNN